MAGVEYIESKRCCWQLGWAPSATWGLGRERGREQRLLEEDGEKGQENDLQKESTFVFNFAHMGLIILSRTGLSERRDGEIRASRPSRKAESAVPLSGTDLVLRGMCVW